MKNLIRQNLIPQPPIEIDLGNSNDYLDVTIPANDANAFLVGVAICAITIAVLIYHFS